MFENIVFENIVFEMTKYTISTINKLSLFSSVLFTKNHLSKGTSEVRAKNKIKKYKITKNNYKKYKIIKNNSVNLSLSTELNLPENSI